ncbi:MAG: MMPL family transporter [Deltaproteobacteria bacterium]|nr:MMPL family transporter [Deltaproteobacteria bacterium]
MNPFGWYTKSVVKHPWITIVLFTAGTLLFAAGIPKVQLNNDIQQFFPQGDTRVDVLNEHRATFGPDDTTLTIVVDLGDKPSKSLQAPWLLWVDAVGKDLRQIEGVTGVGSITETSMLHGKDGELIISPLFGTESVFDETFNERFEYLSQSPLTQGRFFSSTMSMTLLTVKLDERYQDPNMLKEPLDAIQKVVNGHLGKHGVTQVHFGGIPFIRHATLGLMQKDVQWLFPISLLVISLLLIVIFRRVPMVLLPLGTIMVGTVWTAGTIGWLGISLTPLSALFPMLILTLGVADAVHFLCRFDSEQQQDQSLENSIIASGTHVGTACLLTSFTTALGFGSLLSTRMDILQSFGLVVAIGVGATYITVMTLLPCGLRLLPFSSRVKKEFHSKQIENILAWSCDSIRSKKIAALGFVMTVLVAIAATGVKVDYFVLKELPQAHPVTQTGHIMNDEFSGMSSIELSFMGPPGIFKTPAGLKILEKIEQKCIEMGVHQPVSFAAVVKELNRHLGDGSFIPDSNQYIAQLLLLLEMGENFDTESYVSYDYDRARLFGSLPELGARKLYQLEKKLDAEIQAITKGTGLKVSITGAASVASLGFHSLLGELITGLAVALGVILLVIWAVYRSWRMALVSIVPNTFPLFLGLACFAILGEPLNFASAVIFTIVIGIAVDDTIHVLSRYQEELDNGVTGKQAVLTATRQSMNAILMTTVILVCGFLVLTFSDFPANRSFGLVGSGLIASALLADLFFLPALLRTFQSSGQAQETQQNIGGVQR